MSETTTTVLSAVSDAGGDGLSDPAASVGTPSASAGPPVDWTAHIPKELASSKIWEPYKGKPLSEVLKSAHDAQSYAIGAIKLPGEKDKPEEATKKWNDIYKKLGRPDAPDGYQHDLPDLKGKANWNEESVKGFNAVAHKLGLNQAQAQGLLNFYGDMLVKQIPDQQQAIKATAERLRGEWGGAFKKNMALAERGVATMVGKVLSDAETEDFLQTIQRTGLNSHPAFIKIMAQIGADHATEDDFLTGDSGPTEDSLDAKIAAAMAKPEYSDARHPLHEEAVNKVLRLHQEKLNPIRKREEAFT